jgi:hypothetical protein
MMKGSQYLVGLTSYSSSNVLIVSSSTIMKFHTPEQEDSKMPAWSHILVGNATMKCVAVAVMSKRCIKCEKGISHRPSFCPKNCDGSSKGMEATRAIRNVLHLHNNQSVFLKTYVMDNDLSTKAIL